MIPSRLWYNSVAYDRSAGRYEVNIELGMTAARNDVVFRFGASHAHHAPYRVVQGDNQCDFHGVLWPDIEDLTADLVDAEVGAAAFIGAYFQVTVITCLLYTSPSPRDRTRYRMPSSA